ncbi:MAG: class I adenylate-forming enzyme family protein [Alphaproteobacteria bacterium]
MYVLEALDFHARTRPHDLAVVGVNNVLSFLHLRNLVTSAAARIRDAGFPPDRPVGIYVTDPVLHFVLILALQREALASFSAHPNYDPPPPGLTFGGYLCDRRTPFMEPVPTLPVDAGWLQNPQNAPPAIEPRAFAGPQSLLRIVASSGTTGTPKAVGLSCEMADRRFDFPGKFGDCRDYPSLSTIGLSGPVGYRVAMTQLQLGNLQIFPSEGLDAVSAILVYGIKVLTASPAQLQAIMQTVENGPFRLQSLRHVRLAGAIVPAVTVIRARSRLCSGISSNYGSAEMGVVAEATGEMLEQIPGCAGAVHVGCKVEIVDNADRALPNGTEGIVRIKSISGASRYLGDAPENATAFRDGWFYPGDLGVLRGDGLLTISGRATEVINSGGVKFSPNIINEFLLTIGGISDVATFGVDYEDRPTEVWSAVLARDPIDEAALIESCKRALGGRAPSRIVQVQQFPRNQMGKVLIADLRRQLTGR